MFNLRSLQKRIFSNILLFYRKAAAIYFIYNPIYFKSPSLIKTIHPYLHKRVDN